MEDERLTQPERQYLRQIALRLRNGGSAQPQVYNPLLRQDELEQAIAAIFAGQTVFSPSDLPIGFPTGM